MKHYTCPYTHLLHSDRCGCRYQRKNYLAEKEFSTCLNEDASKGCIALYQVLKSQAYFALDYNNYNAEIELSVSQQNKIKMGGLLGLQAIISGKEQQTIKDIYALNQLIYKTYGGFSALPFAKLMPSIRSFKLRPSQLKRTK